MPNKPGKPKSKRTPVRLRHRIEKASSAKQRKQRKLAKKNPEWRSRLKKDPGIPNLFPYKDKILQEIEEKKRLKEEDYARRREEARLKQSAGSSAQQGSILNSGRGESEEQVSSDLSGSDDEEDVEQGLEENGGSTADPMSALLESARARAAKFENASHTWEGGDADVVEEDAASDIDMAFPADVSVTYSRQNADTSRRAFDKIFKSVLGSSDVLLYVLDARDPNGTRSQEIEREIAAADGGGKQLIFILNKIDLVPANVLKAWMSYLQRYFPTIPLRASTPAPNAKTFDHKALTVKGTSEILLKALKSYAHSKSLKRSMTVGVVGFPNVGKSSVINILVSRGSTRGASNAAAACPVGAEAGITTSARVVKLDGKLQLLDSPGIVFPSSLAALPSSTSSPSTQSSTATAHTNNKKDPIFLLSPKQIHQAHLTLLSAIPPSAITDPIPAITLLLHRLSHSNTPSSSSSLLDTLLQQYDLPPSSHLISSGPNGNDITHDFLVQVARKRGRLGKGGVPNLQSAATCVLTDWRDGRIRGWMDAPRIDQALPSGPEGQGMGQDGKMMEKKADEKEIVQEWAEEFKLDGLWGGNDEGAGESEEQMQI